MKSGEPTIGNSGSEKTGKEISRGKFISYLVFILPALWMLLSACGGGGGGGGDTGRRDHQ